MPIQFQDRLIQELRQAERGLVTEIQNELKDQGHYNTGRLFQSVKGLVSENADGGTLDIEMNDYHVFVEKGVRAGRIPFGGRSRGAKTSLYIQGLISFFQNKGLSEKEAKGAAFATARKHIKEGIPTSSSYRFATNGRRLKFIDESTRASVQLDNLEVSIQDIWEDESNSILDHFEKAVK